MTTSQIIQNLIINTILQILLSAICGAMVCGMLWGISLFFPDGTVSSGVYWVFFGMVSGGMFIQKTWKFYRKYLKDG
jgi:hypothetical protein